jgi:poly-beta-1,6-N-acetyl-D-glucosamine biosynthesis protein PgaD
MMFDGKMNSTRWQRATEITVTTIFWLAWLYLIMPFVSLLLWVFGIQLFVDEMLVRGGYEALIGELLHYGLVVIAMLAITFVWVFWNLRRYGGHEMRTHQPAAVSLDEIAAASDLSRDTLLEIRYARRLQMRFDARDHILLHKEAAVFRVKPQQIDQHPMAYGRAPWHSTSRSACARRR